MCPVSTRARDYGKPITDEIVIALARQMYEKHSFQGYVAFHYYNEPMLEAERLFHIMAELKKNTPARFLLWTNGTIRPEDERMRLFDVVKCSNYFDNPSLGDYYRKYVKDVETFVPRFDARLDKWEENPIDSSPCLRPLVEVIVDNFGKVHICCQDHKGEIDLGNVWEEDLSVILERRNKILETVCRTMNDQTPMRCRKCKGKTGPIGFIGNICEMGKEYYGFR